MPNAQAFWATPPMQLFFSPVTCALSPAIVMLETGLPHELVVVDLKHKRLPDGADYLAINPLGYVPFLRTADGQGLSEGVAIIQYLADLAPEKQLAPANGSFARYQLISRLNYIATELPKNYEYLFTASATPEAKDKARNALMRHYAYIETILAKSAFLNGAQFSIADAYLFTVTNWATLIGLDLSHFDILQAYMASIAQRPAVQQALQIEAQAKAARA